MFEGLFQPMHLLLILGIALLFFGPKRLPELGKGLGASIRDFKDAMSGQKPDEKASSQIEAPKATMGTTGTSGTTATTATPAQPVNQPASTPAQATQAAPPPPPQGSGGNGQA